MLLGNRSAALALALTTAAAGASVAQAKPDFSGTYVLVVDKSDFGAMPGPATRTDVIDHKDTKLLIKRTIGGPNGDQTVTLNLAFDGKAHTNPTPQGDFVSTLAWDGPVLIMTTNVDTPNGSAAIVDRLTLSPDGKTLTQKRSVSAGGQEIEQTIVLAKQ